MKEAWAEIKANPKVTVTIDGETISLVPWVGKATAQQAIPQAPKPNVPTFGQPKPETTRSQPSVSAAELSQRP